MEGETGIVPEVVVSLTAVATGAAAVSLSPRLRSAARHESAWLTSGLHVLLATAGAAGAAALADSWAEVVAFSVLALACALAVVVDLAEHRLPDAFVLPAYPAVLTGLAVAAMTTGEWPRFARAVLAMAAVGGAFLAMAWATPTGLGLGDVKLAGLLGALLGWFGWVHVLAGTMAAFVFGGIAALALVLARRADRRTALPFGPWLVAGAVVGVAFAPAAFGPA